MKRIDINTDIYLVCFIIGFLLVIYSLYYQFRKATITERSFAFKLTIYSSLFTLIFYTFLYEYIIFSIHSSNSYIVGLLWSLMVSLILYMFANISGIFKLKSDNKYELFIIFMLVYMSISGFGYFGVRVEFTEKFIISKYLYYHSFQTNSYKGIRFVAYNLWYLLIIYFISFITEREIQ